MCLSSKVKTLRDELLENCQYAIDRLGEANNRVYASSNQEDAPTGSTTPNKPAEETTTDPYGTKKSENDISYRIVGDREIMDSFMILTHGVLIQEWELFLYDIFAEGVIHYLSLGDPKFQLRVKELNPTIETVDMRKHISDEIKKTIRRHKEIFEKSRSLFKIEEPELLKEMQKQVQIRHIFQHNRGKIRKQDIEAIEKQSFEIFDDENTLKSYGEGEKILLSQPEIQKLSDTIKKYSEAFQIKADETQSG